MKSLYKKCYDWNLADVARDEGYYPFFHPLEEYQGSHVIIDGQEMIMAGSNNYLGLSLDPRVKAAAKDAIEHYGTSCSGSRFMNGTLDLHEKLERQLSDFTGKEDTICFTTGYQANLGAISALVGRNDYIISDRLNHASIMDGIFLGKGMWSKLNLLRYKHNDLLDLEQKLASVPDGCHSLIVTDGVFSMEGDICLLPELRMLADKYGAGLYLDEAHAIGMLGKTGRGTEEHWDYAARSDLTMCTFSKAFGSIGGFVSGERKVIDYIRHAARSLIFSASMPPANVMATMKALEIMQEEPQRIHRLQQIGRKMIKGFKSAGFNVGTTETPIVPIITGDQDRTIALWQALFNRGIYVNPVLPPAVPPTSCLLRTSYMATHSDEELDMILNACEDEGRRIGLIP